MGQMGQPHDGDDLFDGEAVQTEGSARHRLVEGTDALREKCQAIADVEAKRETEFRRAWWDRFMQQVRAGQGEPGSGYTVVCDGSTPEPEER